MSTPAEDAAAASAALTSAISAPSKVSGDAGSVESHSLADLIEADRYAASKAVGSTPKRGLRITRLLPPGSI